MAIVKDNNLLLQHVRGTLGDQITIYERNGQIIVAVKRGKSTKKPTQKQLDVRWKMTVASAYAKVAIQDPVVKAYYKSLAGPGQNAYNMAVRDAFHSPQIQDIKIESTDVVVVAAKNEFRVASVSVRVQDERGKVIEEGRAVQERNGVNWSFKVTQMPKKGRIRVLVEDLPGNVSVKELLLE
ncbi:hypothetical protein [Chitinophaga sp.]|uniref:hypothetical protein n=1 Tax=Chitinophaga sp. TaxID=1869181 RepID=UPI0031DBD7A5